MSNSIVRVVLTGDAKGLQRAAEESTKSLEHTGKSAGSAGGSIKAGLAVGAGAALAFGVEAVDAYRGAEEAQTRLEVAIKNSGSSWEAHKKRIDAATASGQAFGYDQGQVYQALASLTTGLGSPTKALDRLQLAFDIAKAKGLDLNAASLLVTKASEGLTKPLKALAIDLPIASGGALKLKAAHVALAGAEDHLRNVEAAIHAGRLKGPAAAAALSDALGKVHVAQGKLNVVEAAGNLILDALTKKMGGSAAAEAQSFNGKIDAQAAAFRNVKIEAGKAISQGLVKFQTWSQKVGRPEIMRLQGNVHSLAMEFSHIADHAVPAIDSITTALANLDTKLMGAVGAGLSDIGQKFGLGGASGNASKGAAARDRARLDAINRKNATSGPHAPHHAQPGAASVTVHVHSADPAAVTRAIEQHNRRNGVQR